MRAFPMTAIAFCLSVYRFAFVLPLGVAVLLMGPAAQAEEARSIVQAVKSWTVKVFGASAPGTGVVVGHEGINAVILTAYHVISDASIDDKPFVRRLDGAQYPVLLIRRLAPLDLAELIVAWPNAPISPISQLPHLGGTVGIGGFAQESNVFWWRTGSSEPQATVNKSARPGGYAILHGAPTKVGLSGAGLYNSQGELVGIHGESDVQRTPSGKVLKSGVGLAIPIDFWRDFHVRSASSSSRSITDESNVSSLLLKASWLESLGKTKEAISVLDKAIARDPADHRPRMQRAGVALSRRDFRKALADYDYMLGQGHASPILRINRGNALQGLKLYETALDDYNLALSASPRMPWGLVNRAKALIMLGRDELARKDLDSALMLSPQDPAALRERAYLFQRQGKTRDALSDLNALIGVNPSDAEALGMRGVLRGETADLVGSIEDLTSAIELEPFQAFYKINRGASYARLKLWREAELDFRSALTTRPNDVVLIANLGEAAFFQGRRHEGCVFAKRSTGLGNRWNSGSWSKEYIDYCAKSPSSVVKIVRQSVHSK